MAYPSRKKVALAATLFAVSCCAACGNVVFDEVDSPEETDCWLDVQGSTVPATPMLSGSVSQTASHVAVLWPVHSEQVLPCYEQQAPIEAIIAPVGPVQAETFSLTLNRAPLPEVRDSIYCSQPTCNVVGGRIVTVADGDAVSYNKEQLYTEVGQISFAHHLVYVRQALEEDGSKETWTYGPIDQGYHLFELVHSGYSAAQIDECSAIHTQTGLFPEGCPCWSSPDGTTSTCGPHVYVEVSLDAHIEVTTPAGQFMGSFIIDS